MKKQLLEDLRRNQKIKEAYEAADKTNNEIGKEEARIAIKALRESIANKGKSYSFAFEHLEEAEERGNQYIDISEPYEYRSVESLLKTLKETGIEYFTFSSGWSSAVETAFEFTKNGCTLEGMMEINSQHKAFMSEEFEKMPAYIFKIN